MAKTTSFRMREDLLREINRYIRAAKMDRSSYLRKALQSKTVAFSVFQILGNNEITFPSSVTQSVARGEKMVAEKRFRISTYIK
jgi:hypothetical protein